MRHLLEIDDLSADELRTILDLSERDDLPRVLEGKGAMLLFEKPSARTRTSMEMAVVQLGATKRSASTPVSPQRTWVGCCRATARSSVRGCSSTTRWSVWPHPHRCRW